MKKFRSVVLFFVMLIGLISMKSSTVSADYTIPPNMEWWSEARFGMFIHFGSYSYLGNGEWAMAGNYSKEAWQTKVSANFNPTNYDAKKIVEYAKKAGMKYLVITAKHHEGLAMWDTKVSSFTDYTGTKTYSLQGYTPFGSTGRDVLMELKNACDKAGIKFGLYYSIIDWNHPSQEYNGKTNFTKMSSMEARTAYIKDMKKQLKELVTLYDPAIMWFDGDWLYYDGAPTLEKWWTKNDGVDLYNYMKELSPNIIVNERVARGYGIGDFECPEQKIPAAPLKRPWETCTTMNGSWGYTTWGERSYKSLKTEIQEIVTVVSREGNMLLNIGPKGDGTVDKGAQDTLAGIGKWMDKYSDSIYGTNRNPFGKDPEWGRYTQKGKKVYAHVFNWPKTGILEATSLTDSKIDKVYLLNDTKKTLKYSVSKDIIKITIPKTAPDESDSVVVIEYSTNPSLSRTSIKISEGKKYQLKVYDKVAKSTYTWSSSDKKVATVTKTGMVTGVAEGKATITCKVKTPKTTFNLTCKVTITKSKEDTKATDTKKDDANVTNAGPSIDVGLFTINAKTWVSTKSNIVKVSSKGGTYTVKLTGSKDELSNLAILYLKDANLTTQRPKSDYIKATIKIDSVIFNGVKCTIIKDEMQAINDSGEFGLSLFSIWEPDVEQIKEYTKTDSYNITAAPYKDTNTIEVTFTVSDIVLPK